MIDNVACTVYTSTPADSGLAGGPGAAGDPGDAGAGDASEASSAGRGDDAAAGLNMRGPKFLLVQAVDDHDLEVLDSEADAIADEAGEPFVLAAFKVSDWNVDLSPWEAPAVFGDQDFGAGAEATLAFVEDALIPGVSARLGVSRQVPVVIGGYSLAGLFALWAGHRSRSFAAIAAASPSVWFPGWMDLTKSTCPSVRAVYLSLGDREEKTCNQLMAAVGDCIKEQERILRGRGIPVTLEWNKGNHFKHPDLRTARAFAWCMKTLGDAE